MQEKTFRRRTLTRTRYLSQILAKNHRQKITDILYDTVKRHTRTLAQTCLKNVEKYKVNFK